MSYQWSRPNCDAIKFLVLLVTWWTSMTNNNGALLLSWRWTFDDQQPRFLTAVLTLNFRWPTTTVPYCCLDAELSMTNNHMTSASVIYWKCLEEKITWSCCNLMVNHPGVVMKRLDAELLKDLAEIRCTFCVSLCAKPNCNWTFRCVVTWHKTETRSKRLIVSIA